MEFFELWEILEIDGNFGNVRVDIVKIFRSFKVVEEVLERGRVVVVLGFVGFYNGFRMIFGREGSDYIVVVFGKGLKVRVVLIMSGVDGIYMVDLRRVVLVRFIFFVFYDEFYVVLKVGMKVIYYGVIDVVRGIFIIFGRMRDWSIGIIVGYELFSLLILVYRVVGEEVVIIVVGVVEVLGFDGENGFELGIFLVRLIVLSVCLGSIFNFIYFWLIVDRISLLRVLFIICGGVSVGNV